LWATGFTDLSAPGGRSLHPLAQAHSPGPPATGAANQALSKLIQIRRRSPVSVFGMITSAIFGQARAAQQPAQRPAAPQAGGAMPQMSQPQSSAQAQAAAQAVDVEEVLTGFAQQKGNPDLNWRTSIVDLMKLLDIDSSLANRKALATELGYTGAKDGSAEMNLWLHRKVMEELERNGGRVPAGMKD
jgi:uncharacterized protein DUF3597